MSAEGEFPEKRASLELETGTVAPGLRQVMSPVALGLQQVIALVALGLQQLVTCLPHGLEVCIKGKTHLLNSAGSPAGVAS